MANTWTDRWDERYKNEEFAYGIHPNAYLEEQLKKLTPASILFAAEGEGRNAVYAAKLGWDVTAFDISKEGKNKALQLAKNNSVEIHYLVGELDTLNLKAEQFDALALIFAHFPAAIKSSLHQSLSNLIKKNGYVIFEAFSKNHLQYNSVNEKVGGPKDIDSLFSLEEIKSDFKDFEFLEMEEKIIELSEGLFHNGTASVIRFVARKK
jgi:2-polyprenyl-3-methyl-5-hydroxy-6-metoxy-1,4-benzoquinol methylase